MWRVGILFFWRGLFLVFIVFGVWIYGREVAGEKIDKGKSEQGKCPVCNQNTLATMGKNGEVSVPCSTNDCIGKGNPGSSCAICESRIPSRIVCSNCGSNTTVGSHFGRVEAW